MFFPSLTELRTILKQTDLKPKTYNGLRGFWFILCFFWENQLGHFSLGAFFSWHFFPWRFFLDIFPLARFFLAFSPWRGFFLAFCSLLYLFGFRFRTCALSFFPSSVLQYLGHWSFSLHLRNHVQRVCHIFESDQQLYLFTLAQWLETFLSLVETLFRTVSRKKISSFDLDQLIAPRAISFDVRAAIWAHQNEFSGQNISEKIVFGRNLSIKARSQQNYLENNAGEAGSHEARKKVGESAPVSSAFCGHHSESKNFTNRPDPWSPRANSRKLTIPFAPIRRIIIQNLGGGGCDPSAKFTTCQTRWWLNDWKKVPAFSSISSTTDGEISWVLMKLVCYASHVNAQRKIFHEFRGKGSESWR